MTRAWFVCSILALVATAASGKSRNDVWMDASQPIKDRVAALMAEMTLEERGRQLFAVHNYHPDVNQWANTSVGSLKLSSFTNSTPVAMALFRNQLMTLFYSKSRLHIPPSFHQETLVSATPGGTAIPLPVTLGATWDRDTVRAANEVVTRELRAIGGDVSYAPEVNLYTDPRNGRLQEGFSEDPFLSAELAIAGVQGVQQDGGAGPFEYLPPTGACALAKHYAAYGDASGGQNVGRTHTSEWELREVYMAPWRALFQRAGGRGLMQSHQTIFGVPVHGNAWLGRVLREELSVGALSVSDCSDVGVLIQWGLAEDSVHAAALGLNASVTMDNMCSTNPDGGWTYEHATEAVEQGLVSEAALNASVAVVLAQKFAAGLFDDQRLVNVSEIPSLVYTPENRKVAYTAAQQGAVLLQNNNNALPLNVDDPSRAKVALIGPAAACGGKERLREDSLCEAQIAYIGKPQHLLGNISVATLEDAVRGSGYNPTVVLGTGFEGSAADGTNIDDAVAAAQGVDIVLLAVGDSDSTCNEYHDRASLELPGYQGELLARVLAVKDSNPSLKVIAVLVHGRPVDLHHNGTDYTPVLDAIVATWRPGGEGLAPVWDILEGKGNANFYGRLPQAWPRTVGQVGGPATPWFKELNGKWIASSRGPLMQPQNAHQFDPYVEVESTPQYPFGYGLAYGFLPEYDSIAVSMLNDTTLEVTVTLHNSASFPFQVVETVQVYVTAPIPSPRAHFWKRLVGFEKVNLAGNGHEVTVKLYVRLDDIAVFTPDPSQPLGSPAPGPRRTVAGEYIFSTGPHSLSTVQTYSITLPSLPFPWAKEQEPNPLLQWN